MHLRHGYVWVCLGVLVACQLEPEQGRNRKNREYWSFNIGTLSGMLYNVSYHTSDADEWGEWYGGRHGLGIYTSLSRGNQLKERRGMP